MKKNVIIVEAKLKVEFPLTNKEDKDLEQKKLTSAETMVRLFPLEAVISGKLLDIKARIEEDVTNE